MNQLKKLTQRGDDYAIVIDKSILDLVGIDNKTLLQISIADGSVIVIKPYKCRKLIHNIYLDNGVYRKLVAQGNEDLFYNHSEKN